MLGQSVFSLKFQDLEPSDDIYTLHAGAQHSLNRGQLSEPFSLFMRPTPSAHGTFVMDLDEAPADLTGFEVFVKPYGDSFPGWSLEGLADPSEIWRNQAGKVTAGKSICILSFSKLPGSDAWHVEAQNHTIQERVQTSNFKSDAGEIPEHLLDEIEITTGRNLIGGALEFEAIIDITSSMHPFLTDDVAVPAMLESLQGLSAKINQRPIDVSYGGVHNITLTIQDDPKEVHIKALPSVMSSRLQSEADSEGYLHKRLSSAPSGTAFIYVTDAMPYLDPEEILPQLHSRSHQIRVLLLSEPIFKPSIGNDPRLSMQVLNLTNSQLLQQLDPFV